MIKIKDLRIGNYVKLVEDKEPKQVVGLNMQKTKTEIHNTINLQIDENECELFLEEDLMPIELTEEIIRKFNFVIVEHIKDEVTYQITEEFGNYINFKLIEKWQSSEWGNFYYDDFNIRYVHELQNYYYIITGSELMLL